MENEVKEEVVVNNENTTNGEVVKFNNVPSIVMIIVSFFVGGAIGIGFAIASLITGSKVNELVNSGKIEDAKSKLKLAKNYLLVTYIWDAVIALVLIAYIIFMVAYIINY